MSTNPTSTFKIATRQSPLALWQANFIADRLRALHEGLQVELVTFVTQGDKILDSPLAKIGGKGLFVKELEEALLDGRADMAVHSIKDVPMLLPEGLCMPVICQRHSPFDAFVSNIYARITDLPQGAKVGTSSLRRKAQLLAWRSDLTILDLRGNVGTRLAKLDAGSFDAIILATAGLERLALHDRVRHSIDSTISLPAVGQGALGLECRTNDTYSQGIIAPLLHVDSWDTVSAERSCNATLEGGCQVPIAVHATLSEKNSSLMQVKGLVASEDGATILTATVSGNRANAVALGIQLADKLLAQGAKALLSALNH